MKNKLGFSVFPGTVPAFPGVTASVKMIRFSYSNEDTKDEEERKESGWRDERYLRCQAPSAEPRGVWPCLRDRATTLPPSLSTGSTARPWSVRKSLVEVINYLL